LENRRGARLAEAEAKWREQSASAQAKVLAQAEAARNQADEDLRGEDQLAALQTTLADREAALAKAALDLEQVRERGRQDLDAALAKAKSWEADEAARFAAAQAEWRKQSANALNEATARYQAAEGMLIQMRMQADRARSDAVGGSTRPAGRGSDAAGGSARPAERAGFGARAAERETDAAAIRLPTREDRGLGTQDPKVVIRPKQINSDQQPGARKKRGVFRDIVVVAALAIFVIVTYPSIEPLVPEPWRSNIAAVIGNHAPPANVTVQGVASVASEVNLRAEPSTTARVIATLPRGLKVVTGERRGDWILVQVEGDRSSTQPRRGWVFGSFLKEEPGDVEADDDSETASPAESE
jgi:hypothetical protein